MNAEKYIAVIMIAFAFVAGHTLGYQDALTDEKMRADIRSIKGPKKVSGEKMIRAGYPGLPAHLRCPSNDSRGTPLKDWHAVQADGGNWEIACNYEGSS